jgi:hypothetical protein
LAVHAAREQLRGTHPRTRQGIVVAASPTERESAKSGVAATRQRRGQRGARLGACVSFRLKSSHRWSQLTAPPPCESRRTVSPPSDDEQSSKLGERPPSGMGSRAGRRARARTARHLRAGLRGLGGVNGTSWQGGEALRPTRNRKRSPVREGSGEGPIRQRAEVVSRDEAVVEAHRLKTSRVRDLSAPFVWKTPFHFSR